MSDESICAWHGITCADETADVGVTEINLEGNSLKLKTNESDTVSALFFSLPSLKKLDLRGNDNLPFNLEFVSSQIESLQLSATGLKSLAGIGGASNLKELHVTDNDLTGEIPDEIFNLTAVEKLFLSFNKFNGTLSSRIGELTNLKEFYAFTNELTGELPAEFGNLAQLEHLVIGKNKISGESLMVAAQVSFFPRYLSLEFDEFRLYVRHHPHPAQ
jgi:Leucine-rich repeat (LRR) protein